MFIHEGCGRTTEDINVIELPHRISRDNRRDREQQTLLKSTGSHRQLIPVWKRLATDLFDPWQVVPSQVVVVVVVALLFYVHGKHLRSCRDGQLT